ncbi:nucleotidyltransferase domain-containing protein [Microbacteriaceae bacterium 4G12]
MKEQIKVKLQQIEEENDVKILYAVESGSRAWGFPSKDSDYDVRFIYIHRPEWYLSIDQKRDVLEYPIHDLLDISGWDLRKALQLLAKSNPALLEWLRSPIVYTENYSTASNIRKISKAYISKKASIYHYLHMANGNYRGYLQSKMVRIKKYFYVLRPILACMWLERENSIPPVEFEKLLEMNNLSSILLKEIHELLRRKTAGEELDVEEHRPILNQFIEEKLSYYEHYVKEIVNQERMDIEVLNELFRSTLTEVWECKKKE